LTSFVTSLLFIALSTDHFEYFTWAMYVVHIFERDIQIVCFNPFTAHFCDSMLLFWIKTYHDIGFDSALILE